MDAEIVVFARVSIVTQYLPQPVDLVHLGENVRTVFLIWTQIVREDSDHFRVYSFVRFAAEASIH